jgi:uncharacterized membrane protein YphA (DoxX/SURF4 family)
MNPNIVLYAFGAILMGVTGIWFQDFLMQWQAVPKAIPVVPFAYVSAAILITGGGLLLARREKQGALLLAAFYGLWVVVFHLPQALQSYTHIGAWNAPAEIAFLAMGGLALFASHTSGPRARLQLIARVITGICAIVFGFAHFNYIDFTASMVPAWIPPDQKFWVWATGAGHLAAGLALVSGIRARLAAGCEAAMMGCFVLLLHLPRVIAAPDQKVEWIMLGISSALTGSALLIRKYAT